MKSSDNDTFWSAEIFPIHLWLVSILKVSSAIIQRPLLQITESRKAAIGIHLRKGPATEPKDTRTWK